MKKILLLLLILVSINGLAQFPTTQSQGTVNTKVVSNGGFQAMKGLINGVYADTAAANAGYIDFYTGAQIYCTSDQYFYLRDTLPMRWTKMAKFSDITSGTDIYNANGILTGNRTLTGLNHTYGLSFDSLNTFIVWRNAIPRIGMNNIQSGLFSPNGLNSTYVSDAVSALTFNNNANYLWMLNDSSLFHKRASYEGNIHSTFYPYSLVDKSYVDSLSTISIQNLSYDATNHEIDISGGGTSAVIPFATGSATGIVSTSTQTFAGYKTFTTGLESNDQVYVNMDASATNTIVGGLGLNLTSTGTPANGFGNGIIISTETTPGNTEIGARIEFPITDITAASEDFDYVIKLMAGGSAASEKFRVLSTGQLKSALYGSGTFTGTAAKWLAVDASGNIIEENAPSGSGTINSGTTGRPAYYTGSTTLDDFAAIDYATSGTNVLITTQNTTDVGLNIKGISSQSANLLNVSSSSGTGDLVAVDAAGELLVNTSDLGDYKIQTTSQFIEGSTSRATFQVRTLYFQGYALNNAWIGENMQYEAGGFTHQINGGAGLFYFQGTEGQFRFYASAGPGTVRAGVNESQFKVNADGTVALGGTAINTTPGTYTGASLVANTSKVQFNLETQHELQARFKEISAPATPASGYASLYTKSDGLFYGKDDAGVETMLSNAGGSSTFAGLTDVNLTSITTNDFLKWDGTDWINRSPSQVRTDLSLVVGTNVQAYDADLTIWAGVTPGSFVDNFIATPSSANLALAVTNETGSGLLVFGTSPTLTTPKIAVIHDANSNTQLAFTSTGSAVNYFGISNAATGAAPSIQVDGTDTDVSFTMIIKGAGVYNFASNSTGPSQVRWFEDSDNGSNYAGIVSPSTLGSNVTITLPNASSTLPIYPQQMTYTGMSTARTVTYPDANFTAARTDAAQTFTGTQTYSGAIITTNNAITASGNAATVPVTAHLTTVTNNSAATLTITMTTTSAVDGQLTTVRVVDFSAAAQTISWVNTENSGIAIPTTSNGSTTLPLTVKLRFNTATTKWRVESYN